MQQEYYTGLDFHVLDTTYIFLSLKLFKMTVVVVEHLVYAGKLLVLFNELEEEDGTI